MVAPVPPAASIFDRNSFSFLSLKLHSLHALSPSDIQVLEDLPTTERTLDKDKNLITEGQMQWSAFLIKEGMAMRYRMMPDGGRQILSLLIPGDLCDIHGSLTQGVSHSISTITQLRIAAIPRSSIAALCEQHPNIQAALCLDALQEEAILRERIVSLGRRDARGRISHLLCELFWRYEAIGLTASSVFQIPLTQTELGDILGLTQVHVNRVLRVLREQRLIKVENRKLQICNVNGLQDIAEVSREYLGFRET